MTVYRQYVLEAKQTQKFVSNNSKVAEHKKELRKLQIQMQRINKTLNQINSSKTTPPKVKAAHITREKALQNYLRASIMYKQAVIRQLTNPE
jgi:uncharacterized coiled-coil protein SlyX